MTKLISTKYCISNTSAETSKTLSSDYNFYYQIEDSFYNELENCLSTINIILIEINKYDSFKLRSDMKTLKFMLEIEYTSLLLNYIIPLLEGYKNNEDDMKENMYKLESFLITEFQRLGNKYNQINAFYFSKQQFLLFKQAVNVYLEREQLKASKSGLIYLRFLIYYLKKLLIKIRDIGRQDYYQISEEEIFKLAYKISKVKFLSQILYFYLAPKEMSLFELNTNHPRWLKILENTEVLCVSDFKKGKKHVRFSYFFTNFMHALYYTIEFDRFNKFNLFHIFKLIFYSSYFWLRPGLSKHLRKFYSLRCNLNVIKWSIFESLEHGIINAFYTFNLAEIKQNEIRYISYDKEDLKIYKGNQLRGGKDFIQFRLVSDKLINLDYNPPSNNQPIIKNFYGLMLNTSKPIFFHRHDVIFFVHGGGFFSQTSESHQNYIINWSKNLNAVIFCIDYKLAPHNKYPYIIDENCLAYEKLVSNTEKMFGFRIRKLGVVGDSGGGFIILNIIKYAIRRGIRIPDAACLIYPCSRIVYDSISPSLLMGTRDNFIDPELMSNIQSVFLDLENKTIEDYVKDDRLNFYITDSETLSKFPKTFIVIGTNDPLRDECYLLADILLQHNIEVKIREYLFFCHGFINLSNAIDPYYRKGEDDIECFFRKVFKEEV